MAARSRAELVLEQADPAVREALGGITDLEAEVDELVARARERWPELELDEEGFVRYLAERLTKRESAEEILARVRPDDLWLAYGCARGDRAALAAFDAEFRETVDAIVRRFAKDQPTADELRQRLRDKLFIGKQAPKIADYSGYGFLQNWLRVTAARTFTDHFRSERRHHNEEGGDALLELADDADDLELAFLKRHYRDHFKEAFAEAVAALTSRQRNALRHSVVQDLTIDQIAALYDLHRASAARRVAAAREALLTATRQALMRRLSVDPVELESLMQLISSRVDLSIRRVLGSRSEPT